MKMVEEISGGGGRGGETDGRDDHGRNKKSSSSRFVLFPFPSLFNIFSFLNGTARSTLVHNGAQDCLLAEELLLAITSVSLTSESAPTYSGHSCSNSTFFTANDTFESNLNFVLSSLSSNATRAGTGFYNASAGEDPTDVVFGLSLCRVNVSTAICQDCVATATKEILLHCPLDKVSIIWYGECFLPYSNEYIFATLSTDPALYPINTGIIQEADKEHFSQLLSGNTTNLLVTRASNSQSGNKFVMEEKEFNSYQTLYNLVQCTPDLTVFDCYSCLQKAILPICCGGNQGRRALLPSCNLRYEFYPFYNITVTALPTLPHLAPGGSKMSPLTILAIVIPIVVVVVLFLVGFCFIGRRAMKKYNMVSKENGEE